MPVGSDFLEHCSDASIRRDDVGRALDAVVRPTVELFLLPDLVRLGDAVIGIGDQPEGQVMLVGEASVRANRIRTDADDDRIVTSQTFHRIAELARLARAPAGVVFWIEVQHDPFAGVVAESKGLSVLIGSCKFG